jgi:hypothetical protein
MGMSPVLAASNAKAILGRTIIMLNAAVVRRMRVVVSAMGRI